MREKQTETETESKRMNRNTILIVLQGLFERKKKESLPLNSNNF